MKYLCLSALSAFKGEHALPDNHFLASYDVETLAEVLGVDQTAAEVVGNRFGSGLAEIVDARNCLADNRPFSVAMVNFMVPLPVNLNLQIEKAPFEISCVVAEIVPPVTEMLSFVPSFEPSHAPA